jgi:peptide/nickel transport system permease protein
MQSSTRESALVDETGERPRHVDVPVATGVTDTSVAVKAGQRSTFWLKKLQVGFALCVVLVVIVACALSDVLAPYDPIAISLGATLQPPSAEHWLGTDQLGRDILSRIMKGGQVSLLVAFTAVFLAGVIGGLVGVIAGYVGGVFDAVAMRLADVQFALPAVILALVLVGAVGSSLFNLVIVLSLANWARFARVLRSETLSLRERGFVELAKLSDASTTRIVLRHILPNVMSTFIVLATLDIGIIIILEATLSFLGLGVQPPYPSWGTMIADGRAFLEQAWWISIFPGVVLILTVLSGNILGDAARDRLSPTLSTKW